MIFIVPIVAFFDYTKAYKDKWVDMLIPLIGVGLLVVYFEGLLENLEAYLTKFMSHEPGDDTEIDAIKGTKTLLKSKNNKKSAKTMVDFFFYFALQCILQNMLNITFF